jgi:D-alanine-D-alanine ligase
MAPGTKGFVPVLHAATRDRPDEIDTILAAEAVATAVKELGYSTEIVALSSDLAEIEALPARRPLLVFNLVDAVDGDGKLAPLVPARLDTFGIPYTGCGTSAWRETLSKVDTKVRLADTGLPTPTWSEDGTGLDADAPAIVKPIWEHGSLGLDEASVVLGAEAPQAIAERNARWQTEHFAEAYVGGREFNVSMLGSADGVEVLPIAEITFEDWQEGRPQIVDYEAKWVADSTAYAATPRRFGLEETAPALAARLTLLAQASWILFGLSSYARIDFRVDAEGRPFILEVNVNPCLNPDAGFAAAAGERGLAYEDMIGRIVEASRGPLHVT